MQSGAAEDIAFAFKVTLTKRGIDLTHFHSGVSDLAAMAVTAAMELEAGPCHMHNLSKVVQSGLGTLSTKDGSGAVVDPFTDMTRIISSLKELANLFTFGKLKKKIWPLCHLTACRQRTIAFDTCQTRMMRRITGNSLKIYTH